MEAALSSAKAAALPTPARGSKLRKREHDGGEMGGSEVDEVAIGKATAADRLLSSHDSMQRQLFAWAEDAFSLPCESELSKDLLAAAATWKSSKPAKVGHPQGDMDFGLLPTTGLFHRRHASDLAQEPVGTGPACHQRRCDQKDVRGYGGVHT